MPPVRFLLTPIFQVGLFPSRFGRVLRVLTFILGSNGGEGYVVFLLQNQADENITAKTPVLYAEMRPVWRTMTTRPPVPHDKVYGQ